MVAGKSFLFFLIGFGAPLNVRLADGAVRPALRVL